MKKIQRLSWFIFFLLATSTISAQNRTIDSLKSVLALSGKPDDFKVLWELAYELFDVDKDQAIEYSRRAYSSALENGDSLYMIKSARITGQLLRYLNKLDEAIAILDSALPLARRQHLDREEGLLLGILATSHAIRAEYDIALNYYLQALTIKERIKDIIGISETLNNLGFIYYKLDNPEVALTYYQKALKEKLATNELFDLDRLYINIGLCYCDLQNHEKALDFFNKATAVCYPSCSNTINLEQSFALGVASYNVNKRYLARLYFKRSLNLAIIENDLRFQFENLLRLFEISIDYSDSITARQYLDQIESIPNINDYLNLEIEFYGLGSRYFEMMKDYQRANLFKKKYIELQERSFNSKFRNKFMKIHAQFAEKQNLERIESQAKILTLQEGSIRNQRKLNFSLATSLALIILLVIILFRKVKQKHRLNHLLDQRVKERTIELEKNRDDLKHTHNEQSLILKKVSSELVASLATIRGLAEISIDELGEGQSLIFKEAESMKERIVSYMNQRDNQF